MVAQAREAVTAAPMLMLEVIRMNVMSAMNGMLKTSDCLGQAWMEACRRKA